MASIAKFDQWQNTAGTTYGTVLQSATSFLSTATVISQSGAANENRGTAWYDSGLTVTLTPTSSSSRFLIFGKIVLAASVSDSYGMHYQIVRNGTAVGNGIGGSVYTWGAHNHIRYWQIAGQFTGPINYVDSPATTSALTYKIQVLQSYNGYNILINRSVETGWQSNDSSSITVLEIQA